MSNIATRALVVIAAFLALAGHSSSAAAQNPGEVNLDALVTELERAATSYDVELAESVLERADNLELRVRAGLLVAELLRIEFETLDPGERQARTALGRRIDAAAIAALERIGELPESSERWRMQADLIATRIRSNFRARKHHKEFEAASERALELDEDNARAWVTAAGPFVFAGPAHGQDYDEAIRLLDRALELAPALESALLLRGLAEERRGAFDRALTNWRAALRANPLCTPSKTAIARLNEVEPKDP